MVLHTAAWMGDRTRPPALPLRRASLPSGVGYVDVTTSRLDGATSGWAAACRAAALWSSGGRARNLPNTPIALAGGLGCS